MDLANCYELFLDRLSSTHFCEELIALSVRWMHPTQQHGRRMPPESFERAFLIRIPRVSALAPEMTQHIHSLRAKGVVSCHTASALGCDASTFRKSAGRLCTVPVLTFVIMPA